MTEMMDIRVRHRYVAKGGVSREEVSKKLEALPDLAAQAEAIDYEEKFAAEEAEAAADQVAPVPEAPAPAPAPTGFGGGTFGGTTGF